VHCISDAVNAQAVGRAWDSRRGTSNDYNLIANAALATGEHDLIHLANHFVGVLYLVNLECGRAPN
jgi:hypothetical protein